jgi:hypothetical protein
MFICGLPLESAYWMLRRLGILGGRTEMDGLMNIAKIVNDQMEAGGPDHQFGTCPRCGLRCEVRHLSKVGANLYVELDERGKLVRCHFLELVDLEGGPMDIPEHPE